MGQSSLKMNSNMLIVLSLVAAALCAPQVAKFEDIDAFRPGDTSGSRRTHGDELPDVMAERHNDLFAEDGLSYGSRRKRSSNTGVLSSLSDLIADETEEMAEKEIAEQPAEEMKPAEPYKGPKNLDFVE